MFCMFWKKRDLQIEGNWEGHARHLGSPSTRGEEMGCSQTGHQIQKASIPEDQAGLKGEPHLAQYRKTGGRGQSRSLTNFSPPTQKNKIQADNPSGKKPTSQISEPFCSLGIHHPISCSTASLPVFWRFRCFFWGGLKNGLSSSCAMYVLVVIFVHWVSWFWISSSPLWKVCLSVNNACWLPSPPAAQLAEGWPRNTPSFGVFFRDDDLCALCQVGLLPTWGETITAGYHQESAWRCPEVHRFATDLINKSIK